MERRRCNHHELDNPLSTLECLSSVIDPKGSGINKNRYVVASQDEKVRRYCRGLKGVPLIYVKRSVMVMEPMSEGSVGVRESAEKEKFRQGLRGRVAGLGKRKRNEEGPKAGEGGQEGQNPPVVNGEAEVIRRKKVKGPKGPNPLSVRKPQKKMKLPVARVDAEGEGARTPEAIDMTGLGSGHIIEAADVGKEDESHPSKRKRKRRRQGPKQNDASVGGENGGTAETSGLAHADIPGETSP